MKKQHFKVAICDDEVQICKLMEKKILGYSMKHDMDYEIQIFYDGQSLLKGLNEKTDILFLDVKMPGLNGLETATELRKTNTKVQIVFLSSYREYVFDSFKVNAFRYLLKPLNDEDFNEVMDHLCSLKNAIPHLNYSFGDEHYSIDYNDILYIEGAHGKIFIHCADGDYRWRGALSTWYKEMHMEEHGMFQIHQSYIVNMKKIIRYNSHEVVLEGNHAIPISKRRLDEFKRQYIKQWRDALF